MKTVKRIPVNAFVVNAACFNMESNGEAAVSSPVKLIALSGEVLEHWYWGKVIHDLSGMRHKPRIAIDYEHNPAEIVGYVNKFNTTAAGELELAGALVPQKTHKRTEEIISNAQQEIPYEASINFIPSKPKDITVEKVKEGVEVEVNGKTFTGPLNVIRSFVLRGVAICPYGADSGTGAFLQSENKNEVEIIMDEKDKEIVNKEEKKEVDPMEERLAAMESKLAELSAAISKMQAPEEKQEEKVAPPAEGEKSEKEKAKEELKAFVDRFGSEKAAEYFAAGLSMEDALAKYVEVVKTEKQEMAAKFAAQESEIAELKKINPVKPAAFDKKEGKVLSVDEGAIKAYCKATGADFNELCAAMVK